MTLAARLTDALAGSPLAESLAAGMSALVERRSGDAAAARIADPALAGLARVVATQPEVAGFLSHRPQLFERIATIDAQTLAARADELEQQIEPQPGEDLEQSLDALRLLRREETCLAACCDLGGLVSLEQLARFLSVLAECITRRALALALTSLPAGEARPTLAILGMGKIAGREFTYHSDLDLVFLFHGEAEDVAPASRIGQRLISYLTTMTGAGFAYAVDTRLRPSGRQGMLVASYGSFERYQRDEAETWEHVALLRTRAIAGETDTSQALLDTVREGVLAISSNPWEHLAELRQRVEEERASAEAEEQSIKTGAGGLMDLDFLAAGGLLEQGVETFPHFPSTPALLRAAVRSERVERWIADYQLLRRVEARARWCAGRAVETLAPEQLTSVAELMERGLVGGELLEQVRAARRRIRDVYAAVIEAKSIRAVSRNPSVRSDSERTR